MDEKLFEGNENKLAMLQREKQPNYGVFSGPYFPVFVLNTEIYAVNLRIQSEYGEIQTRKNSVCRYFSRSALFVEGICKIDVIEEYFHELVTNFCWRLANCITA